jgi:hypothetical protein
MTEIFITVRQLTRGRVFRLHLQLLLLLASAVILGSEPQGTHDHILLSQIRDSPNLEGQVPVYIFPRNRVAQLHPQALGSLFVTSYDSLSYGGGILTRLHAGPSKNCLIWNLIRQRTAKKTASTSSSIVPVFVAAGTCLLSGRLFCRHYFRFPALVGGHTDRRQGDVVRRVGLK